MTGINYWRIRLYLFLNNNLEFSCCLPDKSASADESQQQTEERHCSWATSWWYWQYFWCISTWTFLANGEYGNDSHATMTRHPPIGQLGLIWPLGTLPNLVIMFSLLSLSFSFLSVARARAKHCSRSGEHDRACTSASTSCVYFRCLRDLISFYFFFFFFSSSPIPLKGWWGYNLDNKDSKIPRYRRIGNGRPLLWRVFLYRVATPLSRGKWLQKMLEKKKGGEPFGRFPSTVKRGISFFFLPEIKTPRVFLFFCKENLKTRWRIGEDPPPSKFKLFFFKRDALWRM